MIALDDLGTIRFTVYGVAQPQGNKTAFVRNGRAVLVEGRRKESREAFAGWRASIATAARDWQTANNRALVDDQPLEVRVLFYLPRPASTPKRVTYPTKKPDLDKLARAVLDACKGIVISDDSRVVDLIVGKRFAEGGPPCAHVSIRTMP